MFVPLGDQTEEQFCLLAVQLRISNLINHQDSRPEIYPPSAFQTALRLSLFQIFNEVRQCGIVNHLAGLQGLQCQTNSQMSFAYARRSQEDHILCPFYKRQIGKFRNLPSVNARLEIKIKVFQLLSVGEAWTASFGSPDFFACVLPAQQ